MLAETILTVLTEIEHLELFNEKSLKLFFFHFLNSLIHHGSLDCEFLACIFCDGKFCVKWKIIIFTL